MLSVVIPVHNEEPSLLPLYDRLTAVLQSIAQPYEILFVDDASTDRSFELLANLAATVLVSFLMVPFVVHRLGDRMYGIWALVSTFISYYGLMDLGLSTAVARFLAGAAGTHDNARFNRMFNTALRLYFWIAAAILAVGGALAVAAPVVAG
jgi:O-antigen/teichoic acid export membrane protein